MQEDHDAQLAAMAAQTAERIKQINAGAIEERNVQWDALMGRLDDLKFHNTQWDDLQAAQQKRSLDSFDTFWKAWQMRMTAPTYGGTSTTTGGATGSTTTSRPPIVPAAWDPRAGAWGTPMLTRQAGGPVFDTGAAMLHGSRSRPEFVLSADTTALLRGALGGAFTQRQLVGAVAGGGGMTIQSGAFSMPIYGAPGQSPQDIGRAVEQALIGFFRRQAP